MRIDPESTISLKHKDLMALCVVTLESYLGIKINLVRGGPSVSDPCGEIEHYLGLRDEHGNAVAIAVDCSGRLRLIKATSESRS